MPAEKDIPDLVRQYWDKCGHPEKCPEQYRRQDSGSTSTGTDNYGDYGDTKGKPPVGPDASTGERRDTKYYNEGYEDGYKDGMRRGKTCACGGGGCSACRGRSHEQPRHHEPRREPVPERREPAPVVVRPRVDAGCPNCGGNGCNACSGRRDTYNPQPQPIYDTRGRNDDRYYYEQQQQRQRGIDPAVPLAIMGMVLGGIAMNRNHHRGYDNWGGGYNRYDYGREAWEQQRQREMWQRRYQYGDGGYDSEYGYGRRNHRYQQYQYQQYRNRYWGQGW
jgi:hypothetical protein